MEDMTLLSTIDSGIPSTISAVALSPDNTFLILGMYLFYYSKIKKSHLPEKRGGNIVSGPKLMVYDPLLKFMFILFDSMHNVNFAGV